MSIILPSFAGISKPSGGGGGGGSFVNRWGSDGTGHATTTSFGITGAKTVSLWFKAGSRVGGAGFMAMSNSAGSSTSYFPYIYSGKIINCGGSSYWIGPDGFFTNGDWFNVTITSDGTSSSTALKIYVNGNLKAEKANRDPSGITHVGGTSTYYHDSLLDEISVFDYVVSDIHTLRNDAADGTLGTPADLSTFATQPIYWWRWGDEAGASPVDGSGISAVANSGTAGSSYDLAQSSASSQRDYADLTGEAIYV